MTLSVRTISFLRSRQEKKKHSKEKGAPPSSLPSSSSRPPKSSSSSSFYKKYRKEKRQQPRSARRAPTAYDEKAARLSCGTFETASIRSSESTLSSSKCGAKGGVDGVVTPPSSPLRGRGGKREEKHSERSEHSADNRSTTKEQPGESLPLLPPAYSLHLSRSFEELTEKFQESARKSRAAASRSSSSSTRRRKEKLSPQTQSSLQLHRPPQIRSKDGKQSKSSSSSSGSSRLRHHRNTNTTTTAAAATTPLHLVDGRGSEQRITALEQYLDIKRTLKKLSVGSADTSRGSSGDVVSGDHVKQVGSSQDVNDDEADVASEGSGEKQHRDNSDLMESHSPPSLPKAGSPAPPDADLPPSVALPPPLVSFDATDPPPTGCLRPPPPTVGRDIRGGGRQQQRKRGSSPVPPGFHQRGVGVERHPNSHPSVTATPPPPLPKDNKDKWDKQHQRRQPRERSRRREPDPAAAPPSAPPLPSLSPASPSPSSMCPDFIPEWPKMAKVEESSPDKNIETDDENTDFDVETIDWHEKVQVSPTAPISAPVELPERKTSSAAAAPKKTIHRSFMKSFTLLSVALRKPGKGGKKEKKKTKYRELNENERDRSNDSNKRKSTITKRLSLSTLSRGKACTDPASTSSCSSVEKVSHRIGIKKEDLEEKNSSSSVRNYEDNKTYVENALKGHVNSVMNKSSSSSNHEVTTSANPDKGSSPSSSSPVQPSITTSTIPISSGSSFSLEHLPPLPLHPPPPPPRMKKESKEVSSRRVCAYRRDEESQKLRRKSSCGSRCDPKGRQRKQRGRGQEGRELSMDPRTANGAFRHPTSPELSFEITGGRGAFVHPKIPEMKIEMDLSFDLQLNLPTTIATTDETPQNNGDVSRNVRYFLQCSMGNLSDIRMKHRNKDILGTLVHWNEVQKKRSSCDKEASQKIGRALLAVDPRGAKSLSQRREKSEIIVILGGLLGAECTTTGTEQWNVDAGFWNDLECFLEDASKFYERLHVTKRKDV